MDLRGILQVGLNYSLSPDNPNFYVKVWKIVFLISFDKVMDNKIGIELRTSIFYEG